MPTRVMVHLTTRMGGQPKCGKHVPPEKKVKPLSDLSNVVPVTCEDCFKYRNKRKFYIFNELLEEEGE
jgi:hypothetical protein